MGGITREGFMRSPDGINGPFTMSLSGVLGLGGRMEGRGDRMEGGGPRVDGFRQRRSVLVSRS